MYVLEKWISWLIGDRGKDSWNTVTSIHFEKATANGVMSLTLSNGTTSEITQRQTYSATFHLFKPKRRQILLCMGGGQRGRQHNKLLPLSCLLRLYFGSSPLTFPYLVYSPLIFPVIRDTWLCNQSGLQGSHRRCAIKCDIILCLFFLNKRCFF